MQTGRLMGVALDLARRDLYVFPCKPRSKEPAVKWRDWSTTDPGKIGWKWAEAPYNPAIDCGKSGLLVVDCDVKTVNGIEAYRQWLGQEPDTLTVQTPSGGRHYIYRVSLDSTLGNSSRELPAGIDIRGRGGFIVAPDSVLPNGFYKYLGGVLQPAPSKLLVALEPPQIVREPFTGEVHADGAYGYVRQYMAVAEKRNNALYAMSRWLGKFDELLEGERRAVLLEAGMATGLTQRECLKTIDSGFGATAAVSL